MTNEHKCKYAIKIGDAYECDCKGEVDCLFRRTDYNPDGSVNIYICDYITISEEKK